MKNAEETGRQGRENKSKERKLGWIRAGLQWDYVFDWTVLKYQQSHISRTPPALDAGAVAAGVATAAGVVPARRTPGEEAEQQQQPAAAAAQQLPSQAPPQPTRPSTSVQPQGYRSATEPSNVVRR